MNNSKRIINLDASSLRSYGSCIRALKLITVDGYKHVKDSNDIIYGSAFHVFKETLVKSKGDKNLAIQKAIAHYEGTEKEIKCDWLNVGHLLLTCNEYISNFGANRELDNFVTLDLLDTPMVEKKFKIKIYEDDYCIIYLCGTIDDTGRIGKNGLWCFADEKTTRWRNNPRDYFKVYALSTQLITYFWALHWFAKNYPDSIFAEMCRGRLGACINGVFLYQKEPTKFIRSEIWIFDEKHLEEFEGYLTKMAERLASYVQDIPPREGIINGSCAGSYGTPCPFFNACSSPDEVSFNAILKGFFKQKPYNPLEFR